MTARVYTGDIRRQLPRTGRSAYTIRQDSPRTIRVSRDGPSARVWLEMLAARLQRDGYSTELQEPTAIRPLRLRITRKHART
ncbi:hypothetical protein ABT160_02580 [Streptomyces sp. NPDC001941]|uniref:hypothetical protein n=1 Tax=Streptomyces sp. NPDC001941 TaxID=3154659 RepID=UPI00332F1C8B